MKRIYSSEKINFGASQSELKTYIEQLRQGDETVWLVIYGQNEQRFLNYVRTLDNSNHISDTAVENLVEKAYEKFLNRLRGEDLKNQQDLKKYFLAILYNSVMNFFRKPPLTDSGDEWLARIKNEDDSDSKIKAEKETVWKHCLKKMRLFGAILVFVICKLRWITRLYMLLNNLRGLIKILVVNKI